MTLASALSLSFCFCPISGFGILSSKSHEYVEEKIVVHRGRYNHNKVYYRLSYDIVT